MQGEVADEGQRERTVAGWILDSRIGAGAFGEVWRARRPHANLPRALKLIRISDERSFETWRHEIDRLESLSHPNIVRFYDAGVISDGPYRDSVWIATELCERSLAQELRRPTSDTLTDEHGAQLLDEMLAALASAHEDRSVHRDIKPANILLHANGSWKLCDFGTARLFPKDGQYLHTMVMGTIPYMSAAALAGRQDYAADLYALGVTVHEALCGDLLHPRRSGMTDPQYLKLILDTPPRISEALPERWQTVVRELINPGEASPLTAKGLYERFSYAEEATTQQDPASASDFRFGETAGPNRPQAATRVYPTQDLDGARSTDHPGDSDYKQQEPPGQKQAAGGRGQRGSARSQPRPPRSIWIAVMLMYVGAAVSSLSFTYLGYVELEGYGRDQILEREPDRTASEYKAELIANVAGYAVAGLLVAGVWIWVAAGNRDGSRAARIWATAFGGLIIILILISWASETETDQEPPYMWVSDTLAGVWLALAVVIPILLYLPSSLAYSARQRRSKKLAKAIAR